MWSISLASKHFPYPRVSINPSLEVVTSASYLSRVVDVSHVAVFCLEQVMKALQRNKPAQMLQPATSTHTRALCFQMQSICP